MNPLRYSHRRSRRARAYWAPAHGIGGSYGPTGKPQPCPASLCGLVCRGYNALEAEVGHQALDRTTRDSDAFAVELPPDLAHRDLVLKPEIERVFAENFEVYRARKCARTDNFEGSTLLATWSWYVEGQSAEPCRSARPIDLAILQIGSTHRDRQ